MKIIDSLQEWRELRKTLEGSVGFVATMGCLHQGHAALIERSTQENSTTVLSIFVNPTQFNDPQDFQNYPKTWEADCKLASSLKVDYLLCPHYTDMYPSNHALQIQLENEVACIMEGLHRPGHFNGVLTVVMKLLNLVKPTQAYFGEKDYQQYLLVEEMAKSFFLDTKIVPCPIVREASMLALSSRNQRLSQEQHQRAIAFAEIFQQCDAQNIESTQQKLQQCGIKVHYIERYQNRLFAAVLIDDIRLIDNKPLVSLCT